MTTKRLLSILACFTLWFLATGSKSYQTLEPRSSLHGWSASALDPAITEDDPQLPLYVKTLVNGTQPGLPAKVVIVGGGISGLVSAWLLHRAGYNVTILEASNRLGGRMNTYTHDTFPELWSEQGSMRFPASHFTTLTLTRLFNLTLRSFKTSDGEGLFFFDCLYGPVPQKILDYTSNSYDIRTVHKICDCFNITKPEERIFSDELFHKLIQPIKEDLLNNRTTWERVVDQYDGFSVYSFLRHHNISDEAIHMFGVTQNEETYAHLGVVEYLRDILGVWWADNGYYRYPNTTEFQWLKLPEEGLWEIDGGSSLLVRKIAKELESNVIFGARVTKIEDSIFPKKPSVFVTYQKDGIGFCKEKFEYAIVAVPFTIARTINFDEANLSQRMRQAIKAINYVPATKLFLQFRTKEGKPFWTQPSPEVPKRFNHTGIKNGGSSSTGDIIRKIYYPPYKNETARALLLVYNWGSDAALWNTMDTAEKIRIVLEDLSKVHGSVVYDHFETAFSKEWNNDPSARAAFAVFAPGQHSLFAREIKKPQGNLLFIGEHTSNDHSWVHGAVTSAIRAVLQLYNMVNSDSGAKFEAMPITQETRYFPTWDQVKVSKDINISGICGHHMMQQHIILNEGVIASDHKHSEEQFGYVLQGKAMITVGNISKILTAGGIYYVPPYIHHIVRGLENQTIIFESFSPPKKEICEVSSIDPDIKTTLVHTDPDISTSLNRSVQYTEQTLMASPSGDEGDTPRQSYQAVIWTCSVLGVVVVVVLMVIWMKKEIANTSESSHLVSDP